MIYKYLSTCIIFTLLPAAILAQVSPGVLKGKVSAELNSLEGIYIINLKTQKSTVTESGGYFSIPVTAGDSLMLSSIQFKALRIVISQEDIQKDLFFVKMQPLITQLDEVKIFKYNNINAVALGIIPKGQKSYTPAGRKLRTATGLDMQIGLNASMTIDPLLNLLSGRTAMLLKEFEVEKKEFLLRQIENLFENEFFINKLKIPQEYIKGFQYYIVENNRFVAALNDKNKTMATFLIGALATKYLDTISIEKK